MYIGTTETAKHASQITYVQSGEEYSGLYPGSVQQSGILQGITYLLATYDTHGHR